MRTFPLLISGLMLLSILMATPAGVYSAEPEMASTPEAIQPLRVATRFIKPDAFEENGKLVGFSVDLGQSILEQLKRKSVIKTYPDLPQLLNAVKTGQADFGMAAIGITSERDQTFDFSYPTLFAGLQIMVPDPAEQNVNFGERLLNLLLNSKLLKLYGFVLLLMLIPAHLVWYFERNNPEMFDNSSYIPGIFQAFYWSILTLIGQGEAMPNGVASRLVAVFWAFIGIIFVTYFTAIITADITIQELQGSIDDFGDLMNHRVGLVGEAEAVDDLHNNNIQRVKQFSDPEQAFQALMAKQVDAIVAPRPLLLYYASHQGEGRVKVVGTPLRERFYSFVMPGNSPYLKSVNQAILTLNENGTYRKIYRKWFGINP